MKLTNDVIIFDLETTGTWVKKDKIVEIAMIKCRVDGQRETYYQKVNPTIPIPPFVSELIGITDEDVKDAPPFNKIAQDVLDFIGYCDFGGFNVERFDLPLLERELKDAGLTFAWESKKVFDAQKVYHLNEKRDLTAAYKFYCDKEMENAHSAMADTQATLEILERQIHKYVGDSGDIEKLLDFVYNETAEFYDSERKFRWWNGKLYMMFGKYAHQYTLQDVVKNDRGYLEWILSANFSEEIKTLIENALKGQFPVFELKNNNR